MPKKITSLLETYKNLSPSQLEEAKGHLSNTMKTISSQIVALRAMHMTLENQLLAIEIIQFTR